MSYNAFPLPLPVGLLRPSGYIASDSTQVFESLTQVYVHTPQSTSLMDTVLTTFFETEIPKPFVQQIMALTISKRDGAILQTPFHGRRRLDDLVNVRPLILCKKDALPFPYSKGVEYRYGNLGLELLFKGNADPVEICFASPEQRGAWVQWFEGIMALLADDKGPLLRGAPAFAEVQSPQRAVLRTPWIPPTTIRDAVIRGGAPATTLPAYQGYTSFIQPPPQLILPQFVSPRGAAVPPPTRAALPAYQGMNPYRNNSHLWDSL